MSRTIESLKRVPPKDDILNEHIVSTYFYQKSRKKDNKATIKNLKTALLATSAFAAAFLFITLSLIYSNYRLNAIKEIIIHSKIIKVFNDGRLNRDIIRKIEFRGYAKRNSGLQDKAIVFTSSKKYNWADVSLDLRFPVNLTKRNLLLSLQGKKGGEKIILILRDSNNRCCRFSDIYLAANCKTETISLSNIRDDIDLSRITHLRFEYGYLGEGKMDSPVDVTTYIKDIQIIKEA